MLQLLKDRNFFLFWIGETISVIGDHISLIAFPWLVLQMTGSAAMTGFVLAVQGIPRAILMLYGGAIVDRFSPRGVMVTTNVIRFAMMLVMGLLIYFNNVDLVVVFILAGAFGVADAFFYPATTSILPSIAKEDQLQAGNALVQSTNQIAIIFGPVIAGFIIAGGAYAASHDAAGAIASDFESDRIGLARAFLVDASTFIISTITLMLVKVRSLKSEDAAEAVSMWEEFGQGIKFIWSIPAVKLCFVGVAILNFFYMAPVFVGLPVLVKDWYPFGVPVYRILLGFSDRPFDTIIAGPVYVYGIIVGAYGIGALLGGLTAGMTKSIAPEKICRLMFIIFGYSGICLGIVAVSENYLVAMFFFITAGFGDNYIWVHFMAWLQKVTPDKMMGRVMSILMLLAIGLLPIGNAVMGLLFEWDIIVSMVGAAAFIALSSFIIALNPNTKRVTALTETA